MIFFGRKYPGAYKGGGHWVHYPPPLPCIISLVHPWKHRSFRQLQTSLSGRISFFVLIISKIKHLNAYVNNPLSYINWRKFVNLYIYWIGIIARHVTLYKNIYCLTFINILNIISVPTYVSMYEYYRNHIRNLYSTPLPQSCISYINFYYVQA